MKSIKNIIGKISIYFFVINLILLFFCVFLIIYINFYSNKFFKINEINQNIQKLVYDFDYFNADLNLQISESKSIESIQNSYSYSKTLKNIDLAINSTKEYENLNKYILTYKNDILAYLKTINAFVNDSSYIWTEIREYNIDKIKESLYIINNEFINIKDNIREQYYKLIVYILITIFVIFINLMVFIFLQLKFSVRIINFIKKITKLSYNLQNLQDGVINIQELRNKINCHKYDELEDFLSIYLKIINEFKENNNNLNIKLNKNYEKNNLYKSFNKFALSVLNSVNYPILVSNLSDKIMFINKSFCEVFKQNFEDINDKDYKEYIKPEFYFIDTFDFEYQNNNIGSVIIFRDKSFYIEQINSINVNLSFSNLVDFISKKRDLETLSNCLKVFEKTKSKIKKNITHISIYLVQNLKKSKFVYNNLESFEVKANPDLLKFVFNLVFYKIEDDFTIIIKKENNIINLICDTKKSKLDTSDFIKFVVIKLEKNFNLKVDYYSNSKGSRLRFMFLEE